MDMNDGLHWIKASKIIENKNFNGMIDETKSRYELFISNLKAMDRSDYVNEINGNGGFEYNDQVTELIKLRFKKKFIISLR
jgi:hypothetical protein